MPQLPLPLRLLALAALVLAGAPFRASAQAPEYVARSWTTDDGLPHNVVTRIQQDPLGYMWLATMAGLVRFDGHDFRAYAAPADTPTGRRNIRDFAILPDGTVIFVPASGGVWEIKHHVAVRHPSSASLEADTLLHVFPESAQVLWFETTQEIVRWEHGNVRRFGRNQGIARRTLSFSFASDAEHHTWIGGASFVGYYHDGRLVRIMDAADVTYHIAPARTGGIWIFGNELSKWEDGRINPVAKAPWPIGRASVRSMYEDRSGTLWVATSREGVFRFDGSVFHPTTLGPVAEDVSEDREGNIWLATDGGIWRLRTKAFTLVPHVTTVAEDPNGVLWFSAQNEGMVRRTETAEDTFSYGASRTPGRIQTITTDANGHIWIGSPFGIFQASISDPRTMRRMPGGVRWARVLFAARSGAVWVSNGSQTGYFEGDKFVNVAGLPAGQAITAIGEDSAGRIHAGTSRGALLTMGPDGLVPAGPWPAEIEGAVHAIVPDGPDRLWVATADGLVLIESGRTHRFTQVEGLPDDIVLQVLTDDANLWIATPRGLFRVLRNELLSVAVGRLDRVTPISYGPEQGLSGMSPMVNYQPSARRDSRGDLWFCTYKGAIGIRERLLQQDAMPPPVLIDEIRVDGAVLPLRKAARLGPATKRIDFRISALSFAAPERVQVRHQLEGFDPTWVDTPPDRVARYANLPPGEYRLRVIACNSEGMWNRFGATFVFTVLPAWWQTVWFQIGAIVSFAVLVAWGARAWSERKLRSRVERLERENALQRERARIARDMHDELGGSVTGINLLVQRLQEPSERPEQRLLDLLNRRVRRLTLELERVVWTVSPKHTSLDQLAAFIDRFAHNLFADSSIVCRVHGRETIPDVPLTPECQHQILAVTKEAINNVLKHSHAAEAVITLRYAEARFSVSVQDNGDGFIPESQTHSERNGLRNMRIRMNDVHGAFRIRSAPGEGTEVIAEIPIHPEPRL